MEEGGFLERSRPSAERLRFRLLPASAIPGVCRCWNRELDKPGHELPPTDLSGSARAAATVALDSWAAVPHWRFPPVHHPLPTG